MNRSRQVDVLFAIWFGLETILIVSAYVYRPWAKGAYYDLGPVMIILYGFMLPGAFYVIYSLVVLLVQWWADREGVAAAWRAAFGERWAQRSLLAFGVAFLVNALYLLPRPW